LVSKLIYHSKSKNFFGTSKFFFELFQNFFYGKKLELKSDRVDFIQKQLLFAEKDIFRLRTDPDPIFKRQVEPPCEEVLSSYFFSPGFIFSIGDPAPLFVVRSVNENSAP
jgi:hypothetical protein